MATRAERFQDELLVEIARVADEMAGYIDAKAVKEGAKLKAPGGWVKEACEALEKRGLINAHIPADGMADGPDDDISVTITGEGYQRFEELTGAGGGDGVPAADRYVTIDNNSAEVLNAREKLEQLAADVAANNEYKVNDPEDQEQRVAELEASKRLFDAPRLRIEAAIT